MPTTTAAAGCGCAHPTCSNLVPPGWEGGYCVACLDAIARSEDERARVGPLPPADRDGPHARYGFDYPWEYNRR
jgi:hypothetical protein